MKPPELHFMPSVVEEVLTEMVEAAVADKPDLQKLTRHATYRLEAVGRTFVVTCGGTEILRIPARRLEAAVRSRRAR